MWDYIVLGQVPGTTLQVSFEIWLASVVALLSIATYVVRTQKHRFVVLAVVALSIYAGHKWQKHQETQQAKLALKVQNT